VLDSESLHTHGWPNEEVKCSSYFGNLLAISTISERLYFFEVIYVPALSVKAIEFDSSPFINGILNIHTGSIETVEFNSCPSLKDIQIHAQNIELLSEKGPDNYVQSLKLGEERRLAIPISSDMFTIGIRPDISNTEKYRHLSNHKKISDSKEKLLVWGREVIRYEQLYNSSGRFIAICRRRDWEQDEIIIEVKVLDTLNSGKVDTVTARVPKSFGEIVAGTIDLCVVLIFMESGILRIKITDLDIPKFNRSMWEHLGSINVRCYNGVIPSSANLFGYFFN
jgi:hypothetical protein